MLHLRLSTTGAPIPLQTHEGPSSKVVVLYMQRPIVYDYR